MMLARHLIYITVRTERAVFRRQFGTRHLFYELLCAATILYERLDGDANDIVLLRQFQQFRGTHHSTVLTHNLTTEASLCEAGKTTQVHCRLCMSGTDEDTALTRLQREHVSRTTEVYRL